MGGLLRNNASELVGVFCKSVRLDSDPSLKIVPYEYYFLDITGLYLFFYICPFNLLRIGASLIEEHPYYADDKDYIKP